MEETYIEAAGSNWEKSPSCFPFGDVGILSCAGLPAGILLLRYMANSNVKIQGKESKGSFKKQTKCTLENEIKDQQLSKE